MSYDFNADDIFEMAEQLERNGAAFYRRAAETKGLAPEEKNLLLRLAGMEDEHEQTFRTMRAELAGKEKAPTVFDPDGEAALYLRAFVETRVFFERELDTSTMKEILIEAIGAEKDSIVFYLGMKDAVPETLGRGRIEHIVREEMGHIRLLAEQLAALKRAS